MKNMRILFVLFFAFLFISCASEKEAQLSEDSSTMPTETSEEPSSESEASLESELSEESRKHDEESSSSAESVEPPTESISASTAEPIYPSSVEDADSPSLYSILGEGSGSTKVALFISAKELDHTWELDKEKGMQFLSQIGLENFTLAEMKHVITPPDRMIMQEGTPGNYISIGMPDTGNLYVYENFSQALLVSKDTYYYDIPEDTYSQILALTRDLET